jgi:hypothetical protein
MASVSLVEEMNTLSPTEQLKLEIDYYKDKSRVAIRERHELELVTQRLKRKNRIYKKSIHQMQKKLELLHLKLK